MRRDEPESVNHVGYFPDAGRHADEKRADRWNQPEERREQAVKPRVNKRRLALLIACALVFVGSAWALIDYGVQNWRSAQSSEQLREAHAQSATDAPALPTATPEPSPTDASETLEPALAIISEPVATAAPVYERATTYAENPHMIVTASVRTLQERNKDIIGWLSIPDVIDEAVVQRDNAYYLTHDSLGSKNVTGALFLDEAVDLQTVPEKLVIHGHNMKTGRMFGALKKYKVKGLSFLKQNYLIQLESPYETSQYAVFAVSEVDIRPEHVKYLDFCGTPIFGDNAAFDGFVTKLRQCSLYRVNLDVRRGDRLLILATCTGTDDNTRLLVAARRVRDGESMTELKTAIFSASAN